MPGEPEPLDLLTPADLASLPPRILPALAWIARGPPQDSLDPPRLPFFPCFLWGTLVSAASPHPECAHLRAALGTGHNDSPALETRSTPQGTGLAEGPWRAESRAWTQNRACQVLEQTGQSPPTPEPSPQALVRVPFPLGPGHT